MKRTGVRLLVVVLTVLAGTASVYAKRPDVYAIRRVAEIDAFWLELNSSLPFNAVQLIFEATPYDEPYSGEQVWWAATVDDVGKTLVSTAHSDPGFSGVVSRITDGSDDYACWVIMGTDRGIGWCDSEGQFFGDQTGPNGIDLEGYSIDAIGVQVTSWQSYFDEDTQRYTLQIDADLVFDEYVTSKKACNPSGWQDLMRSDGTPFESRKDCQNYFKTG